MPADLRKHVRYPELLLELQAAVYGLYHMTESRGVLQPRGSLDRRERSRDEQPARAGGAADGAELRADEAAGRNGRRVHRDPAVHAGEPEQPDRLDRRPQRRRALRQARRLQLPEEQARRRTAAGRGAHRSERAAVGTVVAVEPAGLARPAAAACSSFRSAADCSTPSRSTCRPSAARCPSCASSCSRCRIGSPTARRSKRRWPGCSAARVAARRGSRAGRARGRSTAPGAAEQPAPPISTALIRDAARDLADYQRLTAEGKLGEAGQRLEALKQKLEQLQRERR